MGLPIWLGLSNMRKTVGRALALDLSKWTETNECAALFGTISIPNFTLLLQL